MSLQDDYAHLRQLAGELPVDLVEEVRRLCKYAGEEATIVFGHGHPAIDQMNALIAETDTACTTLAGAVQQLATFFTEAGPQ